MSVMIENREDQQRAYQVACAKWRPMLEHENMPKLNGYHQKVVTAMLLENTEEDNRRMQQAQQSGWGLLVEDAPTNVTAGIKNYDPVLISMVRRMAPNLVAYDICGVQPMTGPTGLIFTLRAHYDTQTGVEAFYNEPDAAHSAPFGGVDEGAQTQVGNAPVNPGNLASYNSPQAIATRRAEALGYDTTGTGGTAGAAGSYPEMSISIDSVMVQAKSRALKAEYAIEMAQDMRAIHGMDAQTELTNILSTEILAEINREIIRIVNIVARPAAQDDTNSPGAFDLDVDSNGRWQQERFKGLNFQIERECNAVAKATRRGKGNIVLVSADVASALKEGQNLSFEAKRGMGDDTGMTVDDTGTTFVGTLNSGQRVYIDPFAGANYVTVGYRGSTAYDAGVFYCPYVPLQIARAIGENSFQPRIGFKTRYGIVENSFARGVWQYGDSTAEAMTVRNDANGANITVAANVVLTSGTDGHAQIVGRPRLIAQNGGIYDFNSTSWDAAGQNVYYRCFLVENLT